MMSNISRTGGGINLNNRKEIAMTRRFISMCLLALTALVVSGCLGEMETLDTLSDGQGGASAEEDGGKDCNDRNEDIKPDAKEICDDGVDNDCDGKIDAADPDCARTDADGDGFVDDREVGGDDCRDDDPTIYPKAPELCDGKDNDCDPSTPADVGCDHDIDNDGYAATDAGGNDCDDYNNTIHPGAPEICDEKGVDENCDGHVNEGCEDSGPTNVCVPDTAIVCRCPGGYESFQPCADDGMSYDACICTGGGTGGAPATGGASNSGGAPATGGVSNSGGTGGAPATGGMPATGGVPPSVGDDLVAVTFHAILPDSRTADGVKVVGNVDVIRNGEARIEHMNICDSALTQTRVTGSYSCTVYFPRDLWTEREYNFRAEYPNLSCLQSDDYLTSSCPPIEAIYYVGESHGEVVFRGDFLIEVDGVVYDMLNLECVVPNGLVVGGYNVRPGLCI